MAVVLLLCAPSLAAAAAVTVDTTNDIVDGDTSSVAALNASRGADGRISLREAIVASNKTIALDSIRVTIAGTAPHIIALTSALPPILARVVIDGSSAPDYAGTPVIQLDGNAAGAFVDGVSFSNTSDGSTIRGVIIKRCSRDGILIQAGADSIAIAGCWIGTDATNTPSMRNGDDGIEIFGAYAKVGGTGAGDRNVVNHNGDEGINITGASATGNVIVGNFIGLEPNGSSGSGNTDVGIAILPGATANRIGGLTPAERNIISRNFEGIEINTADNAVLGNFIGTDSTGTLNRGNHSDDGVELQSAGALRNRIGDTLTGAGNLIAFNALNGINIAGGSRNAALGNRIHSNSLRGIDLDNNGVTPNDSADGDNGANELQNFPVLDSAITNGVDTIVIYGKLNSRPDSSFRVQFFASNGADASGYGEGEVFLGDTKVTTNGVGKVTFSAPLAALASVGQVLSATATNVNGNTSEFSDTVLVMLRAPVVSVSVSNPTFAYGVQALNSWLSAQSCVITNDGNVAENFVGQFSQLTDGTNIWAISATTNGADSIRAQWSTTSAAGPWSDISAYALNFTIATNVAASGSVTLWFRIQTPTSTSSFNPHSSTLTVTAEAF